MDIWWTVEICDRNLFWSTTDTFDNSSPTPETIKRNKYFVVASALLQCAYNKKLGANNQFHLNVMLS